MYVYKCVANKVISIKFARFCHVYVQRIQTTARCFLSANLKRGRNAYMFTLGLFVQNQNGEGLCVVAVAAVNDGGIGPDCDGLALLSLSLLSLLSLLATKWLFCTTRFNYSNKRCIPP